MHDMTSTRRLLLVASVRTFGTADQHEALWAKLDDRSWSPSEADCPVPWRDVQEWYVRVLHHEGRTHA